MHDYFVMGGNNYRYRTERGVKPRLRIFWLPHTHPQVDSDTLSS